MPLCQRCKEHCGVVDLNNDPEDADYVSNCCTAPLIGEWDLDDIEEGESYDNINS